MQSVPVAIEYAKNVIKDRWPEAEPIIMKDPYRWELYKEYFNIK